MCKLIVIKRMKIKLLTTFLAVSSLVCASAADIPATLKDYFAQDKFIQGAHVKAELSEEFQKAAQEIMAAVNKAPKEAVEELQKLAKPDEPIPFSDKIGITKAQYDKYIAEWNKRKLQNVEIVGARLEPTTDGKWKLKAISAQGTPLAICNLEYDSTKDEWTSPNGKLVRKEDVKFSKDNLFREWSGPQWQYENKDDLGTVVETFATGKSPDGKNVFLVYRLVELATNGKPTFQNMYILNFPGENFKKDALKDAAKERAKNKKN